MVVKAWGTACVTTELKTRQFRQPGDPGGAYTPMPLEAGPCSLTAGVLLSDLGNPLGMKLRGLPEQTWGAQVTLILGHEGRMGVAGGAEGRVSGRLLTRPRSL